MILMELITHKTSYAPMTLCYVYNGHIMRTNKTETLHTYTTMHTCFEFRGF